ncbi:MAG: phosphoglycerate mutase family protein [Hyphomonadaceae bacterium]|nr:phosphoglycerate mutase family protein [Hyphomonadaceae bacterium]
MKRVWVFRHAESLSNAGGKTLDPEGIPLTENGLRQARELAWSLKEAPSRLVTSPFRRAIDTAKPIDARHPEAINEVWPIQEFTYLDPASCVGTNWADRKPRIDAYWAKLDPRHIDGEGAESFSTLLHRARTFLQDLTELEDDLTITVSHGQFMQATKLMALRPDLSDLTAMSLFIDRQLRRPFANCERMELLIDGKTIRVSDS